MLKAILHTRPARQLDTIFTSADLQRLGNTVEVIWGQDEQMSDFDIGRMVAGDVEAIAAGLPPIRMQVAQPERVARR